MNIFPVFTIQKKYYICLVFAFIPILGLNKKTAMFKKYLNLLKPYVILFAGGYLFCLLISFEFNPLKWSEFVKFLFFAPVILSLNAGK